MLILAAPGFFQWENLPPSLSAFMARNRPEDTINPYLHVLFSEEGGWFVRSNSRYDYDPTKLSKSLIDSLHKLEAYKLNQFLLEFIVGKDDQLICTTTKGHFYWANIPQDTELWKTLDEQYRQGKNLECAALSFHDSNQYFLRFGDSMAYFSVRNEYKQLVIESVRSADLTDQQTQRAYGAVMPSVHSNLLANDRFWHTREGNPYNTSVTHRGDARTFRDMMQRLQNLDTGPDEIPRGGTGDISMWPEP